MDVACGWKPIPPGSDPAFRWPGHIWELILTLKTLEHPHGPTFNYRSIETDIIAFCLERVTGKRLRNWSRRRSGRRSAPRRAPASRWIPPAMRWLAAGSMRRCAITRASA
jgi:hypothetical protein